MSDHALRHRTRTAISGDLHDQANLIVAQLRAGEILPALVSLHAELGDETAGLVVTPSWAKSGGADKPDENMIRDLCSDPEHGLAYDDPLWGRMCYVPAGVSVVGSKDDDQQAYPDEQPQHLVYTDAFYLAQYPATLDQWRAAGGSGGQQIDGGQTVVNVSWDDYQKTLKQASAQAGASYRVYRGGGWDYGARHCRAANRDRRDPAYRRTNLGFRPASAVAQEADRRANRGGSWFFASTSCRASYRSWDAPDYRDDLLGFRVALSPPQDSYRLPLEDEFERAARGWDARIYPWGNDWIEDRAERLSKPSPWGIYGLCGEAWLWTQDEYVADRRPLIQQPDSSVM